MWRVSTSERYGNTTYWHFTSSGEAMQFLQRLTELHELVVKVEYVDFNDVISG